MNRWYEVSTDRYSTPDPIGWRDAASIYIYAVGEPTRFIDPDGLVPLQNDSHIAIPYKPEEGPNPIALCLPGQTCDVDGVYPPSCHGNPIKIVASGTKTGFLRMGNHFAAAVHREVLSDGIVSPAA